MVLGQQPGDGDMVPNPGVTQPQYTFGRGRGRGRKPQNVGHVSPAPVLQEPPKSPLMNRNSEEAGNNNQILMNGVVERKENEHLDCLAATSEDQERFKFDPTFLLNKFKMDLEEMELSHMRPQENYQTLVKLTPVTSDPRSHHLPDLAEEKNITQNNFVTQYSSSRPFTLEWLYMSSQQKQLFDKFPLAERIMVLVRENSRTVYETLIIESLNDVLRITSFDLIEYKGMFYNPRQAMPCVALGIEIWPGFNFQLETAAVIEDGFTVVRLDVCFGIFGTKTVLELIRERCLATCSRIDEEFEDLLIGETIFEILSGNILVVEKIFFNKNPSFAYKHPFFCEKVRPLHLEYKKLFNVDVDRDQPIILAVLREKNSKRTPVDVNYSQYVLPEFCYIVGPNKMLINTPTFKENEKLLVDQLYQNSFPICQSFLNRILSTTQVEAALVKAYVRYGKQEIQERGRKSIIKPNVIG